MDPVGGVDVVARQLPLMSALTVVWYCRAMLSRVCPAWITTGTQPVGGGQFAGGVMDAVGERVTVGEATDVGVCVAVGEAEGVAVAVAEAVGVTVVGAGDAKPPSAMARENTPRRTNNEAIPNRIPNRNLRAVSFMPGRAQPYRL